MTDDVSVKSTKKELLDAVNELKKELAEREKLSLNPEKIKKEIEKKAVLEDIKESISSDVNLLIQNLKLSISKELSELSEQIETEANKYKNLQKAIELKQKELQDLYGIEGAAEELSILIESQKRLREEFEIEASQSKQSLAEEIKTTKESWLKEKEIYQSSLKEEKEKIALKRKQENEEYDYNLKRQRELERNKYNDEIEKLEKELKQQRESFDAYCNEKTQELEKREKAIAELEKNMEEMNKKVQTFPVELEKAVTNAIKDTEKRLVSDHSKSDALLHKGFEGERNVLETKIAALEKLVESQTKQIEKLNVQQEKAYEKVQDIASKAVSGVSERLRNISTQLSKNEAESKS